MDKIYNWSENKQQCINILKQNCLALNFINEELKNDKEVVKVAAQSAMNYYGSLNIIMNGIGDELKNDSEFMEEIRNLKPIEERKNKEELKIIPWTKNKNYVVAMLKMNPLLYEYIDESIKEDVEVLKAYKDGLDGLSAITKKSSNRKK